MFELFVVVSLVLVMWIVNVVIVSLLVDISDGCVYFMLVNLCSKLYCVIEYEVMCCMLLMLFVDFVYFVVYEVLIGMLVFGDEGVVNYMCFCVEYGKLGIEFFVYGCVEYCCGFELKCFLVC